MLNAAKSYLSNLVARRPRAVLFGAGAGAAVTAFALPLLAQASIKGFFLGLVAELFAFLTEGMAYLLFLEVRGLLVFAQYSNFVNPGPKAVEYGWIVTRDLANMFFILILLLIAFSTILGREEYGYKKNLPKLLIMAVVINFSKTICGILIDFGQVVMLTFVNGFIQAAGGNFLRAFQIDKMLDLRTDAATDQAKLALGMMLAFILVTVATAVVLVMMVMLAWRIIVLWLLIILSPIAFLANATGKSGAGYYGKWWEKFRTQIIVGPMLAFFLWLTLIAVQASSGNIAQADQFATTSTAADAEIAARSSGFPTEASRTDVYLSFVIATCLLMAGLQMSIEASDGLAKDFGGKVMGGLKKAAAYLPKKAVDYSSKAATKVAKKGVDLATSPVRSVGGGLAAVGRRGQEAVLRRGGKYLANSRVIGGVARSAALKGEAMRAERLKKKYGTSNLADVARLSPNQFNKYAAGAVPEEAAQFAQLYQNNPALLAQAQKSGAAKHIAEMLKQKAKPDKDGNLTDAAGKKAYEEFMRANWAQETDPEKRKKVFKGMSGEETLKYVSAEKMGDEGVVDAMTKDQLLSVMKNGTPQQKARLAGRFETMEANKSGSVATFMNAKGLSVSQVPADFLESQITRKGYYDVSDPTNPRFAGAEGQNVTGENLVVEERTESSKLFVEAMLRSGRRDPSVVSKMVENPKMAAKMGTLALADLKHYQDIGKPSTDIEFRNAVSVAVQTGSLSKDAIVAQKDQILTGFSVKDLASMVRYAPPDRDDIQQALQEAVTAVHASASPDVAKRIAQNPQLSEYIKKSVAQGVAQAVAQATPPPAATPPAPPAAGPTGRGAGAWTRGQQGGGGTPPARTP